MVQSSRDLLPYDFKNVFQKQIAKPIGRIWATVVAGLLHERYGEGSAIHSLDPYLVARGSVNMTNLLIRCHFSATKIELIPIFREDRHKKLVPISKQSRVFEGVLTWLESILSCDSTSSCAIRREQAVNGRKDCRREGHSWVRKSRGTACVKFSMQNRMRFLWRT